MSILATRQGLRPRTPKQQRFFTIRFEIEGDSYIVSRLAPDTSVATAAFRFRKLTGDEAVYDVRFPASGVPGSRGPECDCMGFLSHGRCKHSSTIEAASKVFCLS